MNLIAQEPTHVEKMRALIAGQGLKLVDVERFVVCERAKQIRPARMRLQLTLRRAADKIGISPTDLSYLEQGRYTLSESDWDELFAKLEGR